METNQIPEQIQSEAKKNGTKKIHVPIRKHEVLKDNEGQPLSTMSLIKLLSENRKPDGMSTSEMRSLWKALDKVEAVNEESTVLEFEPNEAKILLELSKSFKFTIADRFFTDFEDSLL